MIRRFKNAKIRRKVKVRSKIKGTAKRPRLSVFRSNKAIYAQLIDDEKGKTLVAASEKELRTNKKKVIAETRKERKRGKESPRSQERNSKTEKAKLVGELLAKKALKKKIKSIVFDRGPYRYHGRVKALAEGARKAGLKF